MKLSNIQQALNAPKKNRNDFGKYNFRSLEEILAAVKPLCGEGAIILTDEVVSVGNRLFVKAIARFRSSDDDVSTTAYAELPLKMGGMHEPQITGAASSYARKYAISGLLAIDNETDLDSLRQRDERANVVKSQAKDERRAHEYDSGEIKARIEAINSSEELKNFWAKDTTPLMKEEFRDLIGRHGNDIKKRERNEEIIESLIAAEAVALTKGDDEAEEVALIYSELDQVEQAEVWTSIPERIQNLILTFMGGEK